MPPAQLSLAMKIPRFAFALCVLILVLSLAGSAMLSAGAPAPAKELGRGTSSKTDGSSVTTGAKVGSGGAIIARVGPPIIQKGETPGNRHSKHNGGVTKTQEIVPQDHGEKRVVKRTEKEESLKVPRLEHPGEKETAKNETKKPESHSGPAPALAHETKSGFEEHGPDLRTTLGHQTAHNLPSTVGVPSSTSSKPKEGPHHQIPGLTVLGGAPIVHARNSGVINGTAVTRHIP